MDNNIKKKLIDDEIKKINKLIKDIEPTKKSLLTNLVSNAAYMSATLVELQQKIDEIGAIEMFKNGSQEMMRENCALKSYNTTIKNYNSMIKQLIDLLPDDKKDESDELMQFLKKK